jgi:hypothetical protein
MNLSFHVAEGNDDFYAVASLWPEAFGPLERNPSAQHLIANAFRQGSAILARHTADGAPLAATVLDFTSYANALFVPFILIGDAVSNRAATQRRMLDLVLRSFEASGVGRLLFITDDSREHRGAVDDFNAAGNKVRLPAALKIIGHADNLFGDGRDVIFHQLFIPPRERPDVVGQATGTGPASASRVRAGGESLEEERADASSAGGSPPDAAHPTAIARPSVTGAAGIGAQVLSERLMAAACCSGCNEKSGKDKDGGGKEGKESGKDGKEGGKEGKEGGKEGKDKDGIERLAPSGKLNVETPGVFEFYARLGIQRFNRYSDAMFGPLV